MSTIENNVTAKKFRLRTEDKNTLSQKGSMYVGTGNKSSEDPTVCETVATTPPEENCVLTKDNTQIGGLGWKNIIDVVNSSTNEEDKIVDLCQNAIYPNGGDPNLGSIEVRLKNAVGQNVFQNKGSLIAGNGQPDSSVKYAAVTPPTSNTQVLIQNTNVESGLEWKDIIAVVNDAGDVAGASVAELSKRTQTTDITHMNWSQFKTTDLKFEDNYLYQILGVDTNIAEGGSVLIPFWFYAPPTDVMTDIEANYFQALPSVVYKISSGTFTYEFTALSIKNSNTRTTSFSIKRTKEGSSDSQVIPFYYRKIR